MRADAGGLPLTVGDDPRITRAGAFLRRTRLDDLPQLIDVLAGRKTAGKLGGGVKMNGRPCGTLFKRISAYVAQEDVFVPTMTAWETLVFHATLTLPKVRWS